MIFEVKVPNRGPVRTRELEDIDFTIGESPRILINMAKYFRDLEGDPLRFMAENLPAGVTMQANGPWLYGRPTEDFDGTITVTARDTVSGLTQTQQFRITAIMANRPPSPGPDISFDNQVVEEDADLLIPSNAFSDPDGDVLRLTASGLPARHRIPPATACRASRRHRRRRPGIAPAARNHRRRCG